MDMRHSVFFLILTISNISSAWLAFPKKSVIDKESKQETRKNQGELKGKKNIEKKSKVEV